MEDAFQLKHKYYQYIIHCCASAKTGQNSKQLKELYFVVLFYYKEWCKRHSGIEEKIQEKTQDVQQRAVIAT